MRREAAGGRSEEKAQAEGSDRRRSVRGTYLGHMDSRNVYNSVIFSNIS